VIAEKAERHPALRQPLTRRGLRAILERERLTLVVQPSERSAQLVPTPAGWFIILSDATSHAERFVLTLHELAHYWLHVAIDEIVSYDISPPWYHAVREAEADAFAELLIATRHREEIGALYPL
jgi:transposase InsO family protein